MAEAPFTMGKLADRYGITQWQARRVFERGLMPPAPRVGAYRVVAAEDLPQFEDALRVAGYLPAKAEAQAVPA